LLGSTTFSSLVGRTACKKAVCHRLERWASKKVFGGRKKRLKSDFAFADSDFAFPDTDLGFRRADLGFFNSGFAFVLVTSPFFYGHFCKSARAKMHA
jgi:hypothetical protein